MRLWAWVYDCLHEHVCAQMYEFERVFVPARVCVFLKMFVQVSH